jgi:hypothetical protein
MRIQKKFARIPPTEILFLHRKLGGLYLLFQRLRVKLPVKDLVAPYAMPPGDAEGVNNNKMGQRMTLQ